MEKFSKILNWLLKWFNAKRISKSLEANVDILTVKDALGILGHRPKSIAKARKTMETSKNPAKVLAAKNYLNVELQRGLYEITSFEELMHIIQKCPAEIGDDNPALTEAYLRLISLSTLPNEVWNHINWNREAGSSLSSQFKVEKAGYEKLELICKEQSAQLRTSNEAVKLLATCPKDGEAYKMVDQSCHILCGIESEKATNYDRLKATEDNRPPEDPNSDNYRLRKKLFVERLKNYVTDATQATYLREQAHLSGDTNLIVEADKSEYEYWEVIIDEKIAQKKKQFQLSVVNNRTVENLDRIITQIMPTDVIAKHLRDQIEDYYQFALTNSELKNKINRFKNAERVFNFSQDETTKKLAKEEMNINKNDITTYSDYRKLFPDDETAITDWTSFVESRIEPSSDVSLREINDILSACHFFRSTLLGGALLRKDKYCYDEIMRVITPNSALMAIGHCERGSKAQKFAILTAVGTLVE